MKEYERQETQNDNKEKDTTIIEKKNYNALDRFKKNK